MNETSQVLGVMLSGLHIAGAALALHALSRPHSAQGTIAWMLGLLLAPVATIPFYMLLGVKRIHRHTTSRHGKESIQAFLKTHAAWQAGASTLSRTLRRSTGYAPCSGNAMQILQDGNETYQNMLQSIREARHSILLEFFIIRNDRVGTSLRQILEERARAGVQVFVIYDEVGSHKLPAGYLKSLRQAGVQVNSINGRRFWLSSILRINYRNHRKLVVIDSKQAYLGSLNIGLEYTRETHRPYWRDTFIHLKGPIVIQCLLSFADDWKRATGQDITRLAEKCAAAGQTTCQLVPSGPENGPLNNWQLTLLEMAATARERFWLASPYFVPTEAVRDALCAAAMRGVDVRILVPRRGDNTAAQLAMYTFIPGMLAAGVQMLAYHPGFLHEKVCVVDNGVCSIGTANLDERSLRLNFELTLLMEDTTAASAVAGMLQQDMEHATLITPAHWYKAPLYIRLLANCCKLLSPAL